MNYHSLVVSLYISQVFNYMKFAFNLPIIKIFRTQQHLALFVSVLEDQLFCEVKKEPAKNVGFFFADNFLEGSELRTLA